MNFAAAFGSLAPAPAPHYAGLYRSRFAIAGITVEVRGDAPESADLGPQLLPFAVDDAMREDIDVQVEWNSSIATSMGRELFHSGCLWSAHKFGTGLHFDFTTERLGSRPYKRLVVDQDFEHARVILNRQCLTADDASRALEYPLDELLITHYLSLGRGVELHGCGMARADSESFLFVGHSGAGKSTTARLWKRHMPVEVLSDDRIIVRRTLAEARQLTEVQSETSGAEAQSHRESLIAAVNRCATQNQGSSGSDAWDRDKGPAVVNGCATQDPTHKFVMHGTPWHGEAAFASPGRAPLRRIFILQHGRGNHIERLSPSAAVGELLARSFTPFYQSRFVDPVLALLEEIVESVPCYRFQFVPDQSAVERILEFHD